MAEGTERLKTLLEVATGIYSEIGESKEVLLNTRAYVSHPA
jgi:predicted house-cleaning noncanonical NTP pyrophosphatase (MazG superfamily)